MSRATRIGPVIIVLLCAWLSGLVGCATIRTTDPPRTADEQFLQSKAISEAIAKLSYSNLRNEEVYLDTSLLLEGDLSVQREQGQLANLNLVPEYERLYLVAELRNRMLLEGIALKPTPDEANVIVEVRSGAIGINRNDFLLGFPGVNAQIGTVDVTSEVEAPVIVPELAIVKRLRQRGFASVAIVAYYKNSGELLDSSGPAVGRTERTDYWFFGIGPQTSGDIPPVEEE